MIKNLNDFLIGIAVGIRYRANFSIEDQLGKIADRVLYSKNAFFNPSVFPKVYSNVNEKTLVNETTGDHLTINSSNIILETNFGEKFEKNNLDLILQRFEEDIIDGIMKEHKITEINRVGFIRRYLFQIDELANSFITKTIGATLEGINDINLRFSKKIPEQESLVKRDVNDYYTAIFNAIKKADQQELFMSIDFQKYFDPFLPTSAQIDFKSFFERANSFNDNTYLNWLNKNYGVLK